MEACQALYGGLEEAVMEPTPHPLAPTEICAVTCCWVSGKREDETRLLNPLEEPGTTVAQLPDCQQFLAFTTNNTRVGPHTWRREGPCRIQRLLTVYEVRVSCYISDGGPFHFSAKPLDAREKAVTTFLCKSHEHQHSANREGRWEEGSRQGRPRHGRRSEQRSRRKPM